MERWGFPSNLPRTVSDVPGSSFLITALGPKIRAFIVIPSAIAAVGAKTGKLPKRVSVAAWAIPPGNASARGAFARRGVELRGARSIADGKLPHIQGGRETRHALHDHRELQR
jgi:hypothetical protein